MIGAIDALSGITGNIELSGGMEYSPQMFDDLALIKNRNSVNFLLHGYFPPPKEHFLLNFSDTGGSTRDFIRESMRYVKALDIPYYSIHAGFRKSFTIGDNEMLLEGKDSRAYSYDDFGKNVEWFSSEFNDTAFVVENMYPNNNNTECAYLMHIDEILSFLSDFPTVYLLLDLGHLKISSRMLGYNYLNAIESLLEEHAGRIAEIHLSENSGVNDDHHVLYSDSSQYAVIRRYADLISDRGINITIEARNYSIEQLSACYGLIDTALKHEDGNIRKI